MTSLEQVKRDIVKTTRIYDDCKSQLRKASHDDEIESLYRTLDSTSKVLIELNQQYLSEQLIYYNDYVVNHASCKNDIIAEMIFMISNNDPISSYDLMARYDESYNEKWFNKGLDEVYKYTLFILWDEETRSKQRKLAYLYGLHYTLENKVLVN